MTPSQTEAQKLLHVVMLVMQSVSAEMRRSGRRLEPTQMGSLMKIAVGPCTMTDLARHRAVGLSTISKSVDMLVRRGWVERWVDKHDRRHSLVRLTAAGRRTLSDIQRHAERHVAEKLSPLTAVERGKLMSVLKRLTAVLGESDAARLGKSSGTDGETHGSRSRRNPQIERLSVKWKAASA